MPILTNQSACNKRRIWQLGAILEVICDRTLCRRDFMSPKDSGCQKRRRHHHHTLSLHVQSCLRSNCTLVTMHSGSRKSLVDPRCQRSTVCQMTAPTRPRLCSDWFAETTELSAVRVRYPWTEALSLRASQPQPYQRGTMRRSGVVECRYRRTHTPVWSKA